MGRDRVLSCLMEKMCLGSSVTLKSYVCHGKKVNNNKKNPIES